MRGRKRIYDESFNISLKCEKRYHEVMVYLRASDTEVYMRGVFEIMKERAYELSPEQLELASQEIRRMIKLEQEEIALLERVLMDRQIQKEHEERLKKRTIKIQDERGQEILAVYAK